MHLIRWLLDEQAALAVGGVAVAAVGVATAFGWLDVEQAAAVSGLIGACAATTRHFVWSKATHMSEKAEAVGDALAAHRTLTGDDQ